MTRLWTTTFLALAAAGGLLLAGLSTTGHADEKEKPVQGAAEKTGIASMDWLSGTWSGTDGESVWETCYSTPEGGMIVSASKQITNGKAVMFDYEVFVEKDGKVVLTPFPFGNKSKAFPATEVTAGKAVFENPKHDFPKKFTYQRTKDGELHITLEGEQGGESMEFTLKFKKR